MSPSIESRCDPFEAIWENPQILVKPVFPVWVWEKLLPIYLRKYCVPPQGPDVNFWANTSESKKQFKLLETGQAILLTPSRQQEASRSAPDRADYPAHWLKEFEQGLKTSFERLPSGLWEATSLLDARIDRKLGGLQKAVREYQDASEGGHLDPSQCSLKEFGTEAFCLDIAQVLEVLDEDFGPYQNSAYIWCLGKCSHDRQQVICYAVLLDQQDWQEMAIECLRQDVNRPLGLLLPNSMDLPSCLRSIPLGRPPVFIWQYMDILCIAPDDQLKRRHPTIDLFDYAFMPDEVSTGDNSIAISKEGVTIQFEGKTCRFRPLLGFYYIAEIIKNSPRPCAASTLYKAYRLTSEPDMPEDTRPKKGRKGEKGVIYMGDAYDEDARKAALDAKDKYKQEQDDLEARHKTLRDKIDSLDEEIGFTKNRASEKRDYDKLTELDNNRESLMGELADVKAKIESTKLNRAVIEKYLDGSVALTDAGIQAAIKRLDAPTETDVSDRLPQHPSGAKKAKRNIGDAIDIALKHIRREHIALYAHLNCFLKDRYGSEPKYSPDPPAVWGINIQ